MSSIDTYLQQILSAVYGEQVRGAIHDSIEQCYTDVSAGKTLAETAAEAANSAAEDANEAAVDATAAAWGAVGLAPYNTYNILSQTSKTTTVNNGVTFSFDRYGRCTVTGEFGSGDYSAKTLYNSSTELPFGVEPGDILINGATTTPGWISYNFAINGSFPSSVSYLSTEFTSCKVPENATGMMISFGVSKSTFTEFGRTFDLVIRKISKNDAFQDYITNNITPYNTVNVYPRISSYKKATVNGIDITANGGRIVYDGNLAAGQSSASIEIFNSPRYLPTGIRPGMRLTMANTVSPGWLGFSFYDSDEQLITINPGSTSSPYSLFRGIFGSYVTVPANAVGMILLAGVSGSTSGATYTGHLEIEPILASDMSWATLNNDVMKPFGIQSLGSPPNPVDLNTIMDPGIYGLPTGGIYPNSPWSTATSGLSIVEMIPITAYSGDKNTQYYLQRIWNAAGGEWVRYKLSSGGVMSWSDWRCASIPQAPTSNGNYVLRCSVSNGVPTYTWASN